MSSPFVAEVRMFGFNFAPTGWAQCNGQLLPISQNTALFSLLGTTYGGDGKSTFALPDFQGSVPVGQGQGQGLSEYFLGQMSGVQSITLLQSEIPNHTHSIMATNSEIGNLNGPDPLRSLARSSGASAYQTSAVSLTQLAPQALSLAGGSLPHNNMQPYLTINFCIAMQGIFPARN